MDAQYLDFARMKKLFELTAMRYGGIALIKENPDGIEIKFHDDVAERAFEYMRTELNPLEIFGMYEGNTAAFTMACYDTKEGWEI